MPRRCVAVPRALTVPASVPADVRSPTVAMDSLRFLIIMIPMMPSVTEYSRILVFLEDLS
jgi:hypothetical protein